MHVKYVKLKRKSKLKTRRKGRKLIPSEEPTVPKKQASVQSSNELVHWVKP
jgi:hypothetical protein